MKRIEARFTIEGKPQRTLGFMCASETEEGQVSEIRKMAAEEFGCHEVDVVVLALSGKEGLLKKAPVPAKKWPSKSELGDMRKANLIVLGNELKIDFDAKTITRDDLEELVAMAIEDKSKEPAPA